MPVTSSTTSVKRWPTPDQVLDELRGWANVQAASRPDLVALGYFGSHARGDTGFGSDLDLVAIVSKSDLTRLERNRDWPYERLPVPADLLVYTVDEWESMRRTGGRFARMLGEEAVWVVGEAP
ncbi:MAG: nucleotidyltransferase domain-containing protein [Gemmatimonadetes bacterium]|nr:nucleotidyltransferase domain-containing protein [Gemmatimonadota bacterium]MYE70425.1 nucleotidyltransferase domain-containing protein [Gemmatimonadota bacterium]MYJ69676.1 nucleotidyltransferase domain-containing protein [Gemmatimonadota bacterium]